MRLRFEVKKRWYEADTARPIDITIPLRFNGPQPSSFGTAPAAGKPLQAGSFIGDTRQGGGCNVEEYTFIPHCNGTHTEGAGHITNERLAVHEILRETFSPAALITIKPVAANATNEAYNPQARPGDLLITAAALKHALSKTEWTETLVIRTLPNGPEKLTADYNSVQPAYFSLEAMTFLKKKGVKHLLIDTPSVDRLEDEGRLNAHHIFWGMQAGSHDRPTGKWKGGTITEMIYAPPRVKDGDYLLQWQIPAFMTDAAPSRIFLYAVKKVKR